MNIKQIAPEISVSEQITVEDVASLAASGFRSIICNRPDHEGFGQPVFADIAQAAQNVGIAARYIPVTPGQTDPAKAASEFGRAFAELPKPVLAFCKSGARSTMLWQMSRQG
jgi:sulfide:quinone oxidoreductase